MTPFVLEYDDYSGTTYRLRIEPRQEGPGFWLVREESTTHGWRTAGREAVKNVSVNHDRDVLI